MPRDFEEREAAYANAISSLRPEPTTILDLQTIYEEVGGVRASIRKQSAEYEVRYLL